MADDSSSRSFLRRHWEEYKEFWGERFSFLDNFSRFVNRDKPLPSWSASDVEEFIASDPVHGPTMRKRKKNCISGPNCKKKKEETMKKNISGPKFNCFFFRISYQKKLLVQQKNKFVEKYTINGHNFL
ncbi:hypothetical protein UlMin_017725 [Ulmus minor]